MNSQQALQKLLQEVGGQEKLEKKFGYLAPLIIRYVQGVVQVCPNADESFIDYLAKLKIRILPGTANNFRAYGETYFFPSKINLTKNTRSIKLYSRKEEEPNPQSNEFSNLNFMDSELSAQEPPTEISDSRFKVELDYYKTAIHELNHACCYQTNIMEKRAEGIEQNNALILDGELKSNAIYSKRSGMVMVKTFFQDNEAKKYKIYLANKMIHEGITEYLAHSIFKTSFFNDLMFNKKPKGNAHASISYLPMYYFSAMMEILYDKTLSKSYFAPPNKEQEKNINQIINYVYKLFTIVVRIKLLDKNSEDFICRLEELSKQLADEISICCDNIHRKIEEKWNEISPNDKKRLEICSKFILNKEIWEGFLILQCDLSKNYHKIKFYAPIEAMFSQKEPLSINKLDENLKEITMQK